MQSRIWKSFKSHLCLYEHHLLVRYGKNIPKKEIVIQNYAMTLYLQATLLNNNNQIQDAIALLSIAHNLLSNYSDNCIDASTLSIHQRILLLLSMLLIEDKSYITAIQLNKISLRLCLKEIFFRNFYKKSKTEHNYINIKSL